ncbi:cobalt-precorrin-6A reductase [Streptomyces sp. 150FB]|uniref:cobalt-precorrin-6A reductase n=1 Tax=Streptomyces sp. 150FB TaxID=1576605 RepID=UPI000695C658|nr:cobalt-precorrin-6A reductase [Streptomyces sp. 150FB]
MHETPHLLILGGTTEARRLAESLALAAPAGPRVTTSLAGRVARPVLPPGEVRIGGFGGAEGLAHWLREHRVDALIDATHPFAGTISHNAARAAASAHVPLLALSRPSWVPGEGDDWHRVGSLEEAARALPGLGRRVFLTTGRMGLSTFAAAEGSDGPEGPEGQEDLWYLVRSVDPPEPPYPRRLETLLDRGPFTLEGERDLLRRHRIDVLVTKDSGGAATAPKLRAAREAGLPVVVVRRPPAPQGVEVAEAVEEAVAWAVRRVPLHAPDPAPDGRGRATLP